MTTQPEALLLAERLLEIAKYSGSEYWDDLNDAAAELRRMHDLLGKANALCRIRAEEIERLKAQPEPVIDKSAAVRIATALGWEPKRKPLTEEIIDDIWNYHCDEMGYVSVSDAVELTRSIEALHDIKE